MFPAGVNGFFRVSEIALFPAIHSRPGGGALVGFVSVYDLVGEWGRAFSLCMGGDLMFFCLDV